MIAIIDYDSGNIRSLQNAIDRLGFESVLTYDHNVILNAEKVIFPGVGEASSTRQILTERGLDILIPNLKQPVLGICLGMQLLCAHTEEGETSGLNIFPINVKHFPSEFIVPHMGWNSISHCRGPLLEHIGQLQDVYFVHSYYAPVNSVTVASCSYGADFTAISHYKNFYGMQFHPEKSGLAGAQLIKNFIEVVNGNLSGN